jgi:hypothetical protein
MNYEDMIDEYKRTASHYADLEEYENLTSVGQLHALFGIKFYGLQKYKDTKAKSSCKKCFGRGYIVKQGGGRLRGCICLREKKEKK